MIPSDWTQLGIAGFTLGILFLVVRFFISDSNKKGDLLEAKDVLTRNLIKDFQVHIELCNTNFIKNSTSTSKALEKLTEVIVQNTKALRTSSPSVDSNTVALDKNTAKVEANTNGK